MKKYLSILLALIMLLSLVACGGGDDAAKSETKEAPSSGVQVKTKLFTLGYDEKVWTYDKDSTSDGEDYCSANVRIADPDDPDYDLINAYISVSIEEPYDFRETLVNYGFDQYEYAENKKYETTNIGGVDLLKYDKDGTLIYFNRVENAGATVTIEINADDTSDARISELLKGLKFTVKDVSNVDGPWEWEGTPFSAQAKTATAGKLSVSSQMVELDKCITTFETFDNSVAVVKDSVYLLVDGKLIKYTLANGKMTVDKTIELEEDDYTSVEASSDGSLWLSGSMNDLACLKNDAVVSTYEDIDNFAIHPSGKWGIDFFTENECEKITFDGDSYKASSIKFPEVELISHVNIDENYIYVCGSDTDDNHRVFVYNADGKLQKTLSDADGESLGSITFVANNKNGFIGFDGNLRELTFWDNSGKFVDLIADEDLFSTEYPWFCDSALASNGSIVTIMTEEREDKSALEVVVFTLKGF